MWLSKGLLVMLREEGMESTARLLLTEGEDVEEVRDEGGGEGGDSMVEEERRSNVMEVGDRKDADDGKERGEQSRTIVDLFTCAVRNLGSCFPLPF